ncbi:MAG TPA: helix-turn-helix transcriptional regulator [Puia sp.]|nr:helix-turn-helix transcriptional regulator [Puia sp.]
MLSIVGFLRTIIILGALQGFILSSLLFFSKKKRSSNRILATLIFLISLASLKLYSYYYGWLNSGLAEMIPMIIIMPVGPLIYFYVKSVLDPSFRLSSKERPHFYPVMVDLVPSLTILLFIIGYFTKTINPNPAPWGQFIDTYNTYADIPRWISVSIYLLLAHRYIARYRTAHKNGVNGQLVNYKWVQQIIRVFLVFQAIWFIFLIPYSIPRYYDTLMDSVDWYPIYIPLAGIIYWLGIKGYIVSQREDAPVKRPTNINDLLPPDVIERITGALVKSMEKDKLYLNPNLNVNMVSQHIGTTQKMMSAVLNQHLHKSFNEFINEYRISAFKEEVQKPDTDHLTIAGIALNCGFNSQATFQRTFKQMTGLSPSEYRAHAVAHE